MELPRADPATIRVCLVIAAIGVAAALALFVWPLTTAGGDCGSALRQGPAYDVLHRPGSGGLVFVSADVFRGVQLCDNVRMRNQVLGGSAVGLAALTVLIALWRPRRRRPGSPAAE
jgi:hypothetical protein